MLERDLNKLLAEIPEAERAEVELQVRLGLQVMEEHRGVFAALARGPQADPAAGPEPESPAKEK